MRGHLPTKWDLKEDPYRNFAKIMAIDREALFFFFPAKAELEYFSNIDKGGHKGGQGKLYFTLKYHQKNDFFQKMIDFQTEIACQVAPLMAPLFIFEKYVISAFAGKKK